jgi:hypothetical protein
MTWADAAAAGGDGWRIIDTVGVVRSGAPGAQPVALSNGQVLAADSWVETGKDGRVVLARGHETIVVSPASRLLLPTQEVNGNTQVLQTLGSALYQIGKQQKPHFQVDTPYLAAVVKGTAFTVSVDGEKSSVAVTEGLVEVATPDRSDVEFVRPGFTALVSHGDTKDVIVNESAAKNGGDKSVPEPKASKDEHASKDGVVKIPGTIGELNVDIAQATEGLAAGDTPVVTSATKTAGTTLSTVHGTVSDVATTTTGAVQDTGATVTTAVDTTVTTVVPAVTDAVPTVVDAVPTVVEVVVPTVTEVVVPTVVDITTPVAATPPSQASSTAQTVLSTVVGGAAGGIGGTVSTLLGRGR